MAKRLDVQVQRRLDRLERLHPAPVVADPADQAAAAARTERWRELCVLHPGLADDLCELLDDGPRAGDVARRVYRIGVEAGLL